jgi:fructosamine-3-kinase
MLIEQFDAKTDDDRLAACRHLPDLIPQSAPVLLHGDLWRDNVLTGRGGQPTL